tara:strand:- start:661 stop:909 length:249 start_codon:yes stop_codon:yes gene_type:complete
LDKSKITMENKYYTPKIEQFKVGFEYELQDDNGDWLWSNAPQDIELLKKCIKDKRCRALAPVNNYSGSRHWLDIEDSGTEVN